MVTPASWYYVLIIISVVLLIVSLIHKKDWKLLVLHLNVAAIILPFEIVVLILKGYQYLPGILSDPRLDNYIGSYVSNSFIVPASAVVINAFSLSGRYIIGIAAFFTGIDWCFSLMGIYKHFWWKSIYTGVGLSVLYAISRWIWFGFQEKMPALLFRLAVIYLTYTPIHNIIIFLLNKGGELFRFQLYWTGDSEKVHQVLFHVCLVITALIVTLCIGLRMRLRYRFLGIIVLFLLNWALGEYHIFVPQIAGISAHQLIIVPMITVPVVIIIFSLAKLKYLFP